MVGCGGWQSVQGRRDDWGAQRVRWVGVEAQSARLLTPNLARVEAQSQDIQSCRCHQNLFPFRGVLGTRLVMSPAGLAPGSDLTGGRAAPHTFQQKWQRSHLPPHPAFAPQGDRWDSGGPGGWGMGVWLMGVSGQQ